ncbi:hypothetical protein RvY_03788-2 [Ramazzottius varieornatus]|uniref:Cation/H+ exchanger transmembrane domain-containing protein n=1 Tax=Ramazzottius varieornatus TaxID=947166 RepID=A0A1D1USR4_RAMVA|nr:hypothetical protein RvY_03788-2 [Ramazzottius varieornatus]
MGMFYPAYGLLVHFAINIVLISLLTSGSVDVSLETLAWRSIHFPAAWNCPTMSSLLFPLVSSCLLILTAIVHDARPSRPIGHALSWLPVFQTQAKRQTSPVTLAAINGSNHNEAQLSCSKVAGAADGLVQCRRGGGSAPAPPPASASSGGPNASFTTSTAGHGTSDSGNHSVIHAPEILYIFLTLIIGAIAKYALKLVRHYFVMPYTVFVLILGCIYGALASKTATIQTFVRIASADPNIILLTFLPGLIYEAAFSMQTHLFKKLFFHIVLIGVLGMAINVVAIAYISEQVFGPSTFGWNIHVGLVFSAIVSATDPIAAVAMLKEAGSDKTLTTVLEGTSLLSDTSAVVLFNLFMQNARIHSNSSTMTAADLSVSKEVTGFFLNVFGGPAWGLGVGFLLTQLLSRMSSVWEAELILILSVPYLVFWAADAAFGISGALANLVLGLWMSSHRTTISPDVEELVDRIWEIICLISNTLIFSLVGVIIVETAMLNVSSEDWILLVIINIFLLLVRALSFIVLKPLLVRIGIGPKVFTWSHIFVLSWGGFKGAVTLALGIMGSKDEIFAGEEEERVRAKLLFHSAGVVAFTLLFNASTMRFFLKRLGILDMPLSKMITMHMAVKQIMLTRNQKLDALKTDRYLADADWQRVDDLTKVEASRYGVEDESQTSLWTIHYVTREVSCPSCHAEVQLEPLATELAEMESIARLRLVNAKKTSYWRQYEEGTLSQNGIKYLDDLSDTVLNSDHGVIDAEDVKNALHSETYTFFKKKIGDLQHWMENHSLTARFMPSGSHWRQRAFRIAVSPVFLYVTYTLIVCNMVETIMDWCLLSDWNDVNGSVTHKYFLFSNMGYSAFYTFEAAVKIVGFGWLVYWGRTWWSWNRFDLLLLILTYIDLVLDCLAEFGDESMASYHEGVVSTSIIKIFRFFRLVRFGRALRLLKPVVPRVLHFLDGRVNAHLFVAYDIAKAFIVAQEECAMMVSSVVGYKPLAAKFKTQADGDCRVVLKEIGLLNEKRPDVAAAVKTRQAIRSILNHLHKSVEHMSSQDYRRPVETAAPLSTQHRHRSFFRAPVERSVDKR